MKKAQSERKLNEGKAAATTTLFSSDEIVSQSEQISGVEALTSTYEEFEVRILYTQLLAAIHR